MRAVPVHSSSIACFGDSSVGDVPAVPAPAYALELFGKCLCSVPARAMSPQTATVDPKDYEAELHILPTEDEVIASRCARRF